MRQVLAVAKRAGVQPELVISSPYVRAMRNRDAGNERTGVGRINHSLARRAGSRIDRSRSLGPKCARNVPIPCWVIFRLRTLALIHGGMGGGIYQRDGPIPSGRIGGDRV